MQISVEEITSADRKLTLVFSDEEVNTEVVKRLHKLCRTVSVPGFRKGKVPLKIVESRFREAVVKEVILDNAEFGAKSYLEENAIQPITQPYIENYRVNDSNDHEIDFHYEVLPEVARFDIRGESIVTPEFTVSEQDIDEAVAKWREKHHRWNRVERESKESDLVRVDVQTKVDGEVIDDEMGSKYLGVIPGRNARSEQIEKACIGVKAGDQVTVPAGLNTLESDPDASPENDSSQYVITVHEVLEPVENEFKEEFLETLGVTSEQDSDFREKARARIVRECQDEVDSCIHQQIATILLTINDFSPPGSIVLARWERILVGMGYDVKEMKGQLSEFFETPIAVSAYQIAWEQTKLTMIMSKVIQKYEISADDEDLKSYIRELANKSPNPDEQYEEMVSESDRFANEYIMSQTYKKLREEANCEERQMSVKELYEWADELHQAKGDEPEAPEDADEKDKGESLIVDPTGQPY